MKNFTYNDELYHYGVKGMKWKKHKFKTKDEEATKSGGEFVATSGYDPYWGIHYESQDRELANTHGRKRNPDSDNKTAYVQKRPDSALGINVPQHATQLAKSERMRKLRAKIKRLLDEFYKKNRADITNGGVGKLGTQLRKSSGKAGAGAIKATKRPGMHTGVNPRKKGKRQEK
jgi:hypothetical protein